MKKIGGTNLSNDHDVNRSQEAYNLTESEEVHYQCLGCGAIIQSQNPNDMGYLPASALGKLTEEDDFYCQRCFRLRHYNELQDLAIDQQVFIDRLSSIADEEAFVIHMIDLFDVEGSLMTSLPRFIGHQPFMVVANKYDILPSSVKVNRLVHWLKQVLHQNGLKPEEVMVLSAKQDHTLEDLYQIIEEKVQEKDVYVVGMTNVGKSTFINKLIQHYGGEKEVITTSNHPGTTLDMIEIPLNQEHSLFDTPGIIRSQQIEHYLDRPAITQVLPTKRIKPRVFQLNSEQTIYFAGLGRVDFLENNQTNKSAKTACTFYVSNDLYLHRCKTDKADELYQGQVGSLLSPPGQASLEKLPSLKAKPFHLNPEEDIAIAGLGWFCVNQPVDIKVWAPEGVLVTKRMRMI